MLETLDYTIRIGSTPTFLYFDLYFDLYLYSAYAVHYVYFLSHDYLSYGEIHSKKQNHCCPHCHWLRGKYRYFRSATRTYATGRGVKFEYLSG